MDKPKPYVLKQMECGEFLLEMLTLGQPIDTSLVGIFDGMRNDSKRNFEYPPYKAGEYSPIMARAEGGGYSNKVDYVGLFCFREGDTNCETILEYQSEKEELITTKIKLKNNYALIFDNRLVKHGRSGDVGEKLCLKVWIEEKS